MTSKEKPKKVTLKSIADMVGVHPSTVSRVLNNSKTHRVDEETRKKILEAVAKLQYTPDPLAQSLRTKRTMMIGITVPRLTDFELSTMVTAAQSTAKTLGYQTLIISTENEPDHGSAIQSMVRRRIDGLLIATALRDDPILDELDKTNIPFLLLNRQNEKFASISSDDTFGSYLAVQHLIEQGHTRIGHIAGSLDTSTGYNRLTGYRRALKENNILFREEYIEAGNFDSESAKRIMDNFLQLESPPTAVFAVNDISALGALSALSSQGLTVPEDIALIGYNNSEFTSLLPIPISSVAIPIQEMGSTATQLLINKIAGQEIDSVKFPPELIIRGSSKRKTI